MCVLFAICLETRCCLSSSFKAGEKMFFAPAPQYLDHTYINTRSVCLFLLLLLFGVRRVRGESSFFPNRERRRSSSKKKSKSRDSEKKQKKKRTTLKLRCFCLCPSLAPSLLIMSEEVLSSAFFFLRDVFLRSSGPHERREF
jgi:hypothetical protein